MLRYLVKNGLPDKPLITPAQLSTWINSTDVNIPKPVILDGSFYLDGGISRALTEYKKRRIHNAKFFDIKKCASPSTYPHMLPSKEIFRDYCNSLKIREQDPIVIYDQQGIFSAPRVFFTFKVFQHHPVYILNGGLPAWEAAKYDTTPEEAKEEFTSLSYPCDRHNDELVKSIEDVKHIVQQHLSGLPKSAIIFDARGPERFRGEAQESRPGLASGHMPGALNLPFGRLLNSNKTAYADLEKIEQVFKKFDAYNKGKHIISSCGSGVTACVIWVALYCMDYHNASVYDGSWSEYGSVNANNPNMIEK